MHTLWAPWRTEYVLAPKPDACIFCLQQTEEQDAARFVLKRSAHCFAVLNRYPYAPGHVMVAPFRHEKTLAGLSTAESHDMTDLVRESVKAIEQAFAPDGINVGMNLGVAAGAGIAAHLHMHLVPRWIGDHSFMAVIGQTTVLSEHLGSQYQRLKHFFN